MVATISALSSAAQASAYYEADDYYAEGGLAPSVWQGAGAQALDLAGDVEPEAFRALLDGQLPNGQQLGTMKEGAVQHRPGWDVTMSAPKSVSIMAEVAGDRRLIEAHDRAVTSALAYAERHCAATRIRESSDTDKSHVRREQTNSLTIASFRHDTSRAKDPQLHTHNIIMNMAQDAQGQWRSLEPRALYQLQKNIGAVYRQELAAEVKGLGYEIETAKDSLFEIKGVPAEVIKSFSERATQIEQRLAERGKSRATASAEEKQIAALDTRLAKESVERSELVTEWRTLADQVGFTMHQRLGLIAQAEQIAAQPDHDLLHQGHGALRSTQALRHAIDTLAERQSIFSAAELEMHTGRAGLGIVTQKQIEKAIERANQEGQLEPRTFLDKRGAGFTGFTSAETITNEQRLLRAEAEGRQSVVPLLSRQEAAPQVEVAALKSEHPWSIEQRTAARVLLTSSNRITALQGSAGTAKTSTVIANYAKIAESEGYRIIPLAPTASAARTLGNALNTKGETVAKHLLTQAKGRGASGHIWIIDEASMLSAKDMATLLEYATRVEARVLLVGDTKQLGSVGAGAAFQQLQHAGMETVKLSQIVRQTNEHTKQAVEAALEGNAKKALAALDNGGGQIIEQPTQEQRIKQMAQDYAALTPQEQSRTIVIDPSRAGRDALNQEIREQLKAKGQLTGQAMIMQSLEAKGLTKAEAKQASNYDLGDIIRFAKDFADKGIAKQDTLTITAIDTTRNAITLEKSNGQTIDWRPRQWGATKSEAFTPRPIDISQGDKIQFTRNDRTKARDNGTTAQIISIDHDARTAQIKLDSPHGKGRTQTLHLDTSTDQHIRHGYAQTAHAAQGRTSDRVLIHAESKATNLVDQKMFYVAISRAKEAAAIYTDDRNKLVSGIMERTGERQMALNTETTNIVSRQRSAKIETGL